MGFDLGVLVVRVGGCGLVGWGTPCERRSACSRPPRYAKGRGRGDERQPGHPHPTSSKSLPILRILVQTAATQKSQPITQITKITVQTTSRISTKWRASSGCGGGNPVECHAKEARPCIARFCVHWYDVVRKSDWHALVSIHAHIRLHTTDWRQVKLVKETRRDEIPYITD